MRLSLATLLALQISFAHAADAPDWAASLGAALNTLEQRPDDAAARKDAWRAAMRLGLFEQAAAIGAKLDAQEQASMEGDLIAQAIRHGRIDARTLDGAQRYRSLDAAIGRTDALAASWLANPNVQNFDIELQRRLIDRCSALVERQRSAEAIALYESLLKAGVVFPAWAQSAVAGAYLNQHQAETAEALYRHVLLAMPEDFDANLGLFYALSDRGELDQATAHINAFSASLPARRHRDGRANGERWSAEITGDRARLYAERIQQASVRITARAGETPFNSEVRATETSLYLARGWPRQGEENLRRNLGQDPSNAGLHADHAEVLLNLQRYADANLALARAQALNPDQAGVKRAAQSFDLLTRPELYINAGHGRGQNNSPYGSSDTVIDTWLYSSPLANNWRIFAHNYTSTAEFYGDTTNWIRTGLGGEWRAGNWRATAEANTGNGEGAALLASLRWQANDNWQFDVTANSLSNEMPLQAVRAGVTANDAGLGVTWRINESRQFGFSASGQNFSDDNQRRNVGATWFERWYSGPNWQFDTTLGVDNSQNSLGYAAAYFNPPSASSAWLTAKLQNLTWRNYDYAFRQSLALTGGSYWQDGFGNLPTQAIEYKHSWELGPAASLSYGIGRSLRPYDGVRESRNFGSLTLLWRF